MWVSGFGFDIRWRTTNLHRWIAHHNATGGKEYNKDLEITKQFIQSKKFLFLIVLAGLRQEYIKLAKNRLLIYKSKLPFPTPSVENVSGQFSFHHQLNSVVKVITL